MSSEHRNCRPEGCRGWHTPTERSCLVVGRAFTCGICGRRWLPSGPGWVPDDEQDDDE